MDCRAFEPAGLEAYPTRADWDAEAVDILGSVLDRWHLTAGEVYHGGFAGTVLRVTTADGDPAVLKVGYPHEEAIGEAIALQSFPPGTAPRVLRQDGWAWAMLLEEIRPGTPLAASALPPAEALAIGGGLLARIAAVGEVPGIPDLADPVRRYAATARDRRREFAAQLRDLGVADLVAAAIDELDSLATDAAPRAMVHGDFNPGNILRSPDGWCVVDPKPMIGDSCYDLWPLVTQLGSPLTATDPAGAMERQLGIAAAAAGVDAARSARWAFARCGLNVTWYLREQKSDLAARDAAELRVWDIVRARLGVA